ncbi:hypothetical protein GCWU000325_01488 [Alloprevotella tannerae ATCC 51259]|uniref:Uncharacterized protein n=1 Tax=Alloprevotella tannerae ATCC 51259 TaxID=626522 RepID=C9LGY7_9BACT|nr:hypothetical protein GCWU000325_01488 [Alloprevotella tannerae ATCC 51259]
MRKLQGALKSRKFSVLENLTRLFKNILFSFSAFGQLKIACLQLESSAMRGCF